MCNIALHNIIFLCKTFWQQCKERNNKCSLYCLLSKFWYESLEHHSLLSLKKNSASNQSSNRSSVIPRLSNQISLTENLLPPRESNPALRTTFTCRFLRKKKKFLLQSLFREVEIYKHWCQYFPWRYGGSPGWLRLLSLFYKSDPKAAGCHELRDCG